MGCLRRRAAIEAGNNVVVAVDASIRHDTTAVVVVRRDEREQFHALWRVWEPTRGQEVPLVEVESFVRDLAGHFRVLAVVHDPHYFWHARQRLEDEGVPMVEWQHRRMASATRTLHEFVAHARLRHGGDPVARQHALAAEVKEREIRPDPVQRTDRLPVGAGDGGRVGGLDRAAAAFGIREAGVGRRMSPWWDKLGGNGEHMRPADTRARSIYEDRSAAAHVEDRFANGRFVEAEPFVSKRCGPSDPSVGLEIHNIVGR